MRAIVKEFIEATVDLIDSEEYYEMFTLWYFQFVEEGHSKDYVNLDELFKVFDSAGIDLFHASEHARKDVIAEHMYEYIYDILDNDPTIVEIKLPDVIKHLNSKLYISLIDLNKIFKQVAQHIQSSFDVRIAAPFKIVRNY